MPRPSLHVVRSQTRKPDGRVYEYAYLRYEVWDDKKGRLQPVNVAALGRTDQLDPGRLDALGDFLRAWVRKDGGLPADALRERLSATAPAFRILCSRDFGLRFLAEQAWREIGYESAVAGLVPEGPLRARFESAIFAMVLVQFVAPQSKRGIATWAGADVFFPEAARLDLDTLYDSLDVLEAGYEAVEKRLSERLRELGQAPTEFMEDTTTIACRIRYDDVERAEIEAARASRGEVERPAVVNDPPLRMRGESKAKRKDLPQVVIEAILGSNDIIVHHVTHPGNASDKKMVEPSVEALQRLGYKEVRWVSDAGFNSAENRVALREAKFDFVSSEGTARSSVVRRVLATPGRYATHPEKPELSFKCVRALATEESPARARLYVIRRNENEEAFQLHTLERHLSHIEATLAMGGAKADGLLRHPTYRKYVRRDARTTDEEGRPSGPPILHREAVEHARLVAGKSVIATDDLDGDPVMVDGLYRQLSHLEHAFRDLKSTIEVGPMRHRRADRIRAHVAIAVMARNLGTWLAHKSGMTIEAMRRLFANVRVQEVEVGGERFWERVDLAREQMSAIGRMGYEMPPKRFTALVSGPSNLGERAAASG